MSNVGQPIEELDAIRGTSYLAIQAARAVLKRHAPDLAQYRIAVVQDGDSKVVLFTPKDGQARQNLGARIKPDAELSPDDVRGFLSKMDQLEVVDRIQGSSLLAMQTAVGVFQSHKPDLEQYRITVLREGDSLTVVFVDKDREPGAKGSPGGAPGFEVQMRARDLNVLRSNFLR